MEGYFHKFRQCLNLGSHENIAYEKDPFRHHVSVSIHSKQSNVVLVSGSELSMGISVTQLLILLAIAVVVFGTRRLRDVGSDLGSAIKSFRHALSESEKDKGSTTSEKDNSDAASNKHDNN